MNNLKNKTTKGIWIGLVSESTLLILMIGAAGLACRQLASLNVNANPVSQLDDLLLFICIPSFFLYGIFSIVPAMAYSNYMALFVAILQVIYIFLFPILADLILRSLSNVLGLPGDFANVDNHRRIASM